MNTPTWHVPTILNIRRCIQKFPDWTSGARTANGTALCHWVQLYRYFVSQSSEFCRNNPLCCFSTGDYYCCCLFRYRLSPETFGYTLILFTVFIHIGGSFLSRIVMYILRSVQNQTQIYVLHGLSKLEFLYFYQLNVLSVTSHFLQDTKQKTTTQKVRDYFFLSESF
jgi:hypothetical protein